MVKKLKSSEGILSNNSDPKRKSQVLAEKVPHAKRAFPIVGIGASAGGLEALENFLGNMPKDCGLGFVIVQHLDPTRKGLLVEILQRATPMQVLQIKDRTRIEPNHVYVIPPNKDLSILNGVLHLLECAAPRGLRLPIDFFFRSLAEDWKEQSIGVILSGMGSDGTLGLRAIKEKGGAAFVQDPKSAKFDSMPQSAIEAGVADIVAAAEELPKKILGFLQHVPRVRTEVDLGESDQSALEKVIILLRSQGGHDFSLYKKSTIYRRIERRMSLHQIAKISQYVRYLRENTQETDLLFKELLIGVTSFFRDPAAWEKLKEDLLPEILAAHPGGGVLRAWVAGCSTGEEAYSLAMVFQEALDHAPPAKKFSVQIFATDLDSDAIEKARGGTYPANISADVSEGRLLRFFSKNENGSYSVRKKLRETVIFAPQNLVMNPPFTKLDIVVCRNLLIYFEGELQKKLMPLFHYSLNPGGILFLGSAETVGQSTALFSRLPGKARFYRRLDSQVNMIDFPSVFNSNQSKVRATLPNQPTVTTPPPNLQTLADQVLLQSFSPAAVLVTKEGDILYVSGKTGKFLEPAAGKANWNLFAMAREGLGNSLSEAFYKAVRTQQTVTIDNIKISSQGITQVVDITVNPLSNPKGLEGMVMVIFMEGGKHSSFKTTKTKGGDSSKARLEAMAEELQQAHADLQGTREEMQTSQEELKSTNEELQSMIEELQSTNEELTTSKEEMQSMNEELQTVNHELQAKVGELSHASNDIKNLLDSTDLATLFLDNELRIRRFTPRVSAMIKLITADVGRPITDFAINLEYPELADDSTKVLRSATSIEKQVTTQKGAWFDVRIMPFRTQENSVHGVVITFTDVTVAKNLEAALRKAQTELQSRFSDQSMELGKTQKALQESGNAKSLPEADSDQSSGPLK